MTTTEDLKTQWNQLKKEQPHLRIRNAAEKLGVSEMELLATKIGNGVTRLRPEMKEILSEIESLGKVMALTRNNECVHERKGVYVNGDFSNSHAALFVGDDIDLRIFLNHWKKVFAVVEENTRGVSKSIQFFAKNGEAIHKIFLTDDSNKQAYDTLVDKYKSTNQQPIETTEHYSLNLNETPDTEIAVTDFKQAWLNLKDTHDFFAMLRKFGVTRTQALRLAPSTYHAQQISKSAIVTILEEVAKEKTPIMVFVGNKANIQIHTGAIRKTMWHQDWFNIMDPDFNLHLDMSKIAQTWVVRKPTEDGVVTAIEVFNEMGEIIVQFFGKRKPGIPELPKWQQTIEKLN